MVMKIADGRANDAGQVESEQPTTRHDQGDSEPSFNTSGPSEGGFLHRLYLTWVRSASLFFHSIDSTSARFSDRVGTHCINDSVRCRHTIFPTDLLPLVTGSSIIGDSH